MAHVYLVDGTFELFRCFHGAPHATGRSGTEVGAARGLLATLVSLLAKHDVTHIAVAFDSIVAPLAPPGRPNAEALIGAQQPLAATIVRALGVTLWPAGRFQADDLLATAAARLTEDHDVERVVICTSDNDLAQSVRGERVVVLNRITQVVTDEARVRERFGVAPQQIPDLFALIGDRSDGLAGLPGWGAKSAAAVLRRYGCIESIPDDHNQWDLAVRGAERLAAILRERRAETVLSRELSIRRDDLPLPVSLSAVEWRGARRELIAELVVELDDSSTVERIPRWAS